MKHYKIIILVIISLIISLSISFGIFIINHRNRNITNVSGTTTTSLLEPIINSVPTYSIPKQKPTGIEGVVVNKDKVNLHYEIIRESTIKEGTDVKKIYDVELKTINYKSSDFTKEDINLVAKDILNQLLKIGSYTKEIGIAFFSDREMITDKPFDIAYSFWQVATNEIIITLRKDLKVR